VNEILVRTRYWETREWNTSTY